MTAALLLAAWVAMAPPQAASQTAVPDSLGPPTVSAGVVPESVTVGDRFRAHLRVRLPAGARVRLGLFAANDSLQVVDTVFVRAAGDSAVTAVYPLVAWVAGEPLSANVPLTITLPGGDSAVFRVPLRLPAVRSVLPADTTDLQPRPAKGLLLTPSAASPRWWLLAVPLALAVAALGWWLLRRPRAAPRLDPRAEALARMDRLRETGGAEPYYTAVTRVLREYLARVDGRWGEDLTTDELLGRVGGAALDRAGLASVLRRADPVKFGAVVPAPAETRRFAEDVRTWIIANPRPAGAEREAA